MPVELYTILVGIGASLAVWRVAQNADPKSALRWAFFSVLVLAGALLGARIGYAFWQPAAFSDNPLRFLNFQQGGFIWPGAVIGAWLVIVILAWADRLPFGLVADQMLVMLPPLAAMVWLGCWQAGCAYGVQAADVWWYPNVPDETGMLTQRLPLQWFAALSLFVIFAVGESRFPKRRNGQRAALTWLIFVLHTLLFSWFRADLRPTWQGLPVDIWALFFFAATALIFCGIVFWPNRKVDLYA